MFVIFTTISPVAYIYSIIAAVILVGYSDNKLITLYMIATTIGNVIHVAYLGVTRQITSDTLPTIEIRIASLILFTLFLSISTKSVEKTNTNRMALVNKEKEKISNLASKTQEATVNITKMIENVSTELSNMVQVIGNMLSNSNEQNQVVNDTAKNFEEITAKVASVSEASTKLQALVNNLNIANQQVISGIETISAVTEEVTAHSNETVEISEKNSDIADEVEAIVTTLNQLAEELSDAK